MSDVIEVIRPNQISLNGHIFDFSKLGSNKRIWVCQQRRQRGCKVRLHTSPIMNTLSLNSVIGVHSHEPDPAKVEVKKAIRKIQHEASTSTATPAQILANHLPSLSPAAFGKLPRSDHIKRGIRNVRCKTSGSLVVPHRREDINLPTAFTMTKSNNKFLLFDSGPSPDRIMMFATAENLEFLKNADVMLIDGTFKSSPVLFAQLFVFHGFRSNTSFPCVYCLMPNRTTATYTRLLDALKALSPGLAPRTIMSDYERSSINAFEDAFPLAEQKGCFFHFAQAVFRHIQQLPDLYHMYSTDSDFNLHMRQFIALAFFPPEDVLCTYDLMVEEEFFVRNEVLLAEFVVYFEKTWLGLWNRRRTARNAPLFAIPLWNCYQSILDDLPKTNNSCEGFHNGFASLLGASNPTIYKLINGLQDQQSLLELKIQQLLANSLPPQKRQYKESAESLKQIVSSYGDNNFSPMEHLRRLAFQIKK